MNHENTNHSGPAIPGIVQPVHLPDLQQRQAAEKEYKSESLMKIMYSRGVSLEEAQTIRQKPILDEMVRLQASIDESWDKINLLLSAK